MDASMKRRYAAMAAALEETEDDNFLDRRKQRSCWVKPWMEEKSLGVQHLLYNKLERDPGEYRRLLRVSHDVFLQLLARIESRLQKQNTNMRRPISPATRLQLTLRYLASGTYISLRFHSLSAR